MPIANAEFGNSKDPFSKLQKALKEIENAEIEAQFVDENERPIVTRAYLEMIIGEYTQSAQNPQMFNKWLALDTKLDKALREFKSDVRLLISGQAQLGQAQASLQAEAPPPPPAPIPTPPAGTTPPAPQGAADKGLPVNQK
jgi:hypothetical protein